MSREAHVRFWERARVKSPRATRSERRREQNQVLQEELTRHGRERERAVRARLYHAGGREHEAERDEKGHYPHEASNAVNLRAPNQRKTSASA